MVVHLYYKKGKRFTTQDDMKFSCISGIEKIVIRGHGKGNSIIVTEVEGKLTLDKE